MSYLDLRELADEYATLKERSQRHTSVFGLDEEEQERLKALTALEEQLFTDMESYAENERTMIPEEDFEDYAQDLANDLGYLSGPGKDNPLMSYIDWGSWAEDVKHDYAEVEFEDRTYLIRAY